MRDMLLQPLRLVNSIFDERPWKNRLRAAMLTWRNALPRELMIRRGDTVLQVGMWHPRNLRRLSKCVGTNGRIILVEPSPATLDKIQPLLRAHAIDNVTIIPKAAWNEPGETEFELRVSPTHNRIKMDNVRMLGEINRRAFAGKISVEVDTVDRILSQLQVHHLDYAEITVNGAELAVLKGMPGVLQQTSRLFVAGYARLTEGDAPTNRLTEAYLRELGFRTKITRTRWPTQPHFDKRAVEAWGVLDGHVFAWREDGKRVSPDTRAGRALSPNAAGSSSATRQPDAA